MATIFCFTSTGNSLSTAKKIAEKIGGSVSPMNNGLLACQDDVIGFVFPVYFWGLPRMVERFISDLQIVDKNAYLFAIITSGGQGFGVLGRLKNLLKPKGTLLRYGRRIISVSNYLPEFTPKDSDKLQQSIDRIITESAQAVNNRQSNRIKAYTFINKIAYGLYPNENSDQYFSVAPICTGCMTCQKVCPAKNIIMEAGKPSFQHRCEHCLACLHHCPADAIDWKNKTQGKSRYRNRNISLNELIHFNNTEIQKQAEQ